MNLLFRFENPHSTWVPPNVFKNYFDWFSSTNQNYNITYENTDIIKKMNPSSPHSAHLLTIWNLDNSKYIIVSYWDRAIELTWDGNGWNDNNRVDLITSSGVFQDLDFTPFTYPCYSSEFEILSKSHKKDISEKLNNGIRFRGFLYHHRKTMQEYIPELFEESRKGVIDYFHELNDSKICLSLDGAGEICNRDLEILCCGSVLLRPELTQIFNEPLIPDYHYVAVEKVNNPKIQLDLILEKYNRIKEDNNLLETIGRNGHEWFERNGSIQANVDLLKRLVNIDKLK